MIAKILASLFCSVLLLLSAGFVCGQNTNDAGTSRLTDEQLAALKEASQLSATVVQLHKSKKFDEGLPLARRVVELRRSVLGDNNAPVAEGLTNLAGLYLAKQEFDKAEPLFKQALSSYDGANLITQNTGYVLDMLTSFRWRVRDFDKAELYAKRAVEVKEKVHGASSPQLLDSLQNLIRVYEANGRREEANMLYLRLLAMAEKMKHDLPPRLAQLLVIYRCSSQDEKETADTLATHRRIYEVLGWKPGAQFETLKGGVLNGQALSLPKPPYPEEARRNRFGGIVVVQVEIDECGKVINVKVVSGAIELREASLRSAWFARFSPTLLSGRPVRVTGTIQYNFVAR